MDSKHLSFQVTDIYGFHHRPELTDCYTGAICWLWRCRENSATTGHPQGQRLQSCTPIGWHQHEFSCVPHAVGVVAESAWPRTEPVS
jgi:hypothetical protein